MGTKILAWLTGKALKALALKLFMVYIIPWIFDKLISGMKYLSAKTATKIDDTFVKIQEDAKKQYIKVIEDEF